MATLKDLAEELGISISAASLAIRNHESISLKTRQRVWGLQEKLGYRPPARRKNGAGAPLNRVDKIAFLLVDRSFNDPLYARSFQVVAESSAARRIDAIYVSISLSDLHNGVFPSVLRNREVDGIIVSGVYDQRAHEQLLNLRMPLVVAGNYTLGDEPFASCEVDLDLGIRLVLRRLRELGHHDIGLILRTEKSGFAIQLQRAYHQNIAAEGMASVGIEVAETAASVAPALQSLLGKPTPPTALLLPMEELAVQTYIECGKNQLKVPQDISIVTLGSTDSTYLSFLKVTSNASELGRVAFEKLMHLIADPTAPLSREIFPMKLVPGDSVAPPPKKME